MRRLLGVLLLSLALLQLGFRGIQRVRSDVPMWDFASVYSAARTWLHGGDPYDLAKVAATWRTSGIFPERDTGLWATVYPPTSLLMIAPLGALPAGAAMVIWLVVTIVLLVLQFAALVDLAGFDRRDPRTLILIGGALAAAPLQFGILSGQLSLPAISLCVVAFWCARRERERLAGVLLGIACAIKPQIAGPFVLYCLIVRQWATFRYACFVGAGLCAAALGAMQVSHIDWVAGWTHSIAASSQIGGVNDYGWADEFRDEIVDLKMIFVSLPVGAVILRALIECVFVGLAAWYLRSLRGAGEKSDRSELLALSGLGALLLLAVYHRVYDATLLSCALAWALAELDGPRRRYAVAGMLAMTVFLVPFDLLQSVRHRMPGIWRLAHTAWWQMFIAPYYAWGLLGVTIVLLAAMHCRGNRRIEEAIR